MICSYRELETEDPLSCLMKCPKGWVPGGENLVSCETSKRWISLLGASLGAIPTLSLSTLPQCLLMVVLVVLLNSNKAVWVHPVHGHGQCISSMAAVPTSSPADFADGCKGYQKYGWSPASLSLLLEKTNWNHESGSVKSPSAGRDRQ